MTKKKEGIFLSNLKRTNKDIKRDRAEAIAKNTEVIFKRSIEDIEMSIQNLEIEREARLDLSPENALNLVPVKDFDTVKFVQDDINFGAKIYNEKVILKLAKERYEYLFG